MRAFSADGPEEQNTAGQRQYVKPADLITSKRYVFNSKGKEFRLVADIEFTKKLVFIVWIGTHAEYDKIDVKTVRYVKSD